MFNDESVDAGYEKEWAYVEKLLKESGNDDFSGGKCGNYPFRSRYAHTRRVFTWLRRMLDDVGAVDVVAMEVAVIFHDVGYAKGKNHEHAFLSAEIFHEYSVANDFLPEKRELIEYLIKNHNNKELLVRGSKEELILLMEADIMDEEGAMRIAWDNMAAAVCGAKSFKESLERTEKYFNPDYNPMITPLARNFFQEKQEFVKEYIRRFKDDLGEC
ncbi:MAG: HD domain-containing protein [Lachnospiraceae bacterium]|nr:HD domain-containing protein [Lachnospiraceae bacterium]